MWKRWGVLKAFDLDVEKLCYIWGQYVLSQWKLYCCRSRTRGGVTIALILRCNWGERTRGRTQCSELRPGYVNRTCDEETECNHKYTSSKTRACHVVELVCASFHERNGGLTRECH